MASLALLVEKQKGAKQVFQDSRSKVMMKPLRPPVPGDRMQRWLSAAF